MLATYPCRAPVFVICFPSVLKYIVKKSCLVEANSNLYANTSLKRTSSLSNDLSAINNRCFRQGVETFHEKGGCGENRK